MLIDLGRIDRTPAATLLRVEAVFVSHTHMDHFMGFDQLLRLFLARDATLRLYGPEGIADCVAGKLAGYTWNLTDEYAFAVDVTEIGDTTMQTWRFAARTRFERQAVGAPRPFTGVVFADPVVTVEAAPLDHKIVSMAYAISERTHLNVRTDALAEMGLRPGPWLNALKSAVRARAADDTPIDVGPGDRRPLAELRDALLIVTPGQKIAYVVDTLFSPANARRIVRLAAGADLFVCEAPFLEEDIDQATRRYHLTARAGGRARTRRRREAPAGVPLLPPLRGSLRRRSPPRRTPSSPACAYTMRSWTPDTRRFLEAHRVGRLATDGPRRRPARRPRLLRPRRRRAVLRRRREAEARTRPRASSGCATWPRTRTRRWSSTTGTRTGPASPSSWCADRRHR